MSEAIVVLAFSTPITVTAEQLPLFFNLIDTVDRMVRDHQAPDAGELVFQSLLVGIDHNSGLLSEDDLLDFDKTVNIALVDPAGVDFKTLALAAEQYAEN